MIPIPTGTNCMPSSSRCCCWVVSHQHLLRPRRIPFLLPPLTSAAAAAAAAGSSSSTTDSNTTTVLVLVPVPVRFVLNKECLFGEHFLLVGDHPLLGRWDPSAAIPLQWSDGHFWQAQLDLPVGLSIKYKFLLCCQSGEIKWQPGPDRILNTCQSTNLITVSLTWLWDNSNNNAHLHNITQPDQEPPNPNADAAQLIIHQDHSQIQMDVSSEIGMNILVPALPLLPHNQTHTQTTQEYKFEYSVEELELEEEGRQSKEILEMADDEVLSAPKETLEMGDDELSSMPKVKLEMGDDELSSMPKVKLEMGDDELSSTPIETLEMGDDEMSSMPKVTPEMGDDELSSTPKETLEMGDDELSSMPKVTLEMGDDELSSMLKVTLEIGDDEVSSTPKETLEMGDDELSSMPKVTLEIGNDELSSTPKETLEMRDDELSSMPKETLEVAVLDEESSTMTLCDDVMDGLNEEADPRAEIEFFRDARATLNKVLITLGVSLRGLTH